MMKNQGEALIRALQGYEGWSVTMWFYTISHSELVLRLTPPVGERFTFLVLSGCGDVCIPDPSAVSGARWDQCGDISWSLEFDGGFRVISECWRITDDYPFPTPPGSQ